MTDHAVTPAFDEHVFLVGHPPLGEFLGFVKSQTIEGQGVDIGQLAREWRAANSHLASLEKSEAGIADKPLINPVPKELEGLATKVVEDPIFRNSFNMLPTRIGYVPLDRLVVFQKSINLRFVKELVGALGGDPKPEAVFRFCLPYDHPMPPVQDGQIAQQAFAFVSPSADLRLLDVAVLRPHQITGYSPTGPVAGVVSLFVGFGSNFLNALEIEGRFVLNNGSHRAYALRQLGLSHAPCIIQDVPGREELAVVGGGDVPQRPDFYLTHARPPLLKDYFDPRLTKVLKVRQQLHQVRVAFQSEKSQVPKT